MISKGSLTKAASQAILGTYMEAETLKPLTMFGENFKFFTDSTGNNHQLVKAVLRRRSWFAPSSEPLFPNSEQVQIIWT